MKENIVHIVAAMILGLALPGMVVRYSRNEAVKPTQPIRQAATTAAAELQEKEYGIWVLMDSGSLQWMDMDAYLTGVILAEMPTSFDHQALCAQAVVARTYALRRQTEARHDKGAVCTDHACCQAYVSEAEYLSGLGYEEDIITARAAIADTTNLILTYDDQLIEATYFHSAGGQTEAAVAVWGVEYPYLQAVDSPGEEMVEPFTVRSYFSREDLERVLDRTLPGAPSGWIGWTTYTPGGGVENILFAGVQYSGIRMRSLLSLNSTAFSMEADTDGIWITAKGKGHRVGMSQIGAQAMALEGNTYQQILSHYYPGTRIDKMEDVGYNTSKIFKE